MGTFTAETAPGPPGTQETGQNRGKGRKRESPRAPAPSPERGTAAGYGRPEKSPGRRRPMTPEMEALLAHRAWVEKLALRLVRDRAAAEDVAQDAMLAAIRHPGANPRSIRAWLGTVVRNLVWERMRGETRLGERQARAARREEAPSAAELFERVSIHREVVETLMGLPEHYRDVLVRRYYEGETPSEIARTTGVPVATVKTRLQRGLATMRSRLDRKHGGDGSSWLPAVCLLIRPREPAPLSLAAPAVKVAAAAALVIAGIAYVRAREGPTRPPGAPASPLAALETGADLPAVELAGPAVRGSSRSTPRGSGSAEPSPAAIWTAARSVLDQHATKLRGRVLDVEGRALPGTAVRFEPDKDSASTGAGAPIAIAGEAGGFELRGVRGPGRVVAIAGDLATVFAGSVDRLADGGSLVVVAPRSSVRGLVRDAQGRGLSGATVEILPPHDLRGRFPDGLEGAAPLRFLCRTDESGRFRIDVPSLEGSIARASLEGYGEHSEELSGRDALELVLASQADAPGPPTGFVVDALGSPVPGARVCAGAEVARSGPDGGFRLGLEGARQLVALGPEPDGGAALLEPEIDADGTPSWPSPIRLQLEAADREIAGLVVDQHGTALAGIPVWINDPTLFRAPPPSGSRRSETMRPLPDLVAPGELPEFVESRDAAGRAWRTVRTADDGSFRIDGLLARSYVLAAMDPYTLVLARSEPVRASPAGRAGPGEARIRLPIGNAIPLLRGRVVARDGSPQSGVSVSLCREAFTVRRGLEHVAKELELRPAATTRGDGSFEIEGVARTGVGLLLDGGGILATRYEWSSDREAERGLEIVVALRMRLRVVGAGAAEAIAVRDASGATLGIHLVEAGRRVVVEETPLFDGRSEVLAVPDDAATLVLLRNEEEVGTVPLFLRSGRVNEIRIE